MHGRETIVRYLQDAEAAERNFEDTLNAFSRMGDQSRVRDALANMSRVARTQHQRLRTRLHELGADSSTVKSALAHALAFAPAVVQIGQTSGEKNTQDLMITIAAAAAGTAMYEALAIAAEAADDPATEQLARDLQQEERQDYQTAAMLLRESALDSFRRAQRSASESIKAYLEDAIAAEKSFEGQLRHFAGQGSGEQIHSVFLQHAEETRLQCERLTARLKDLGGDPSGAKSFIAHLVGLSPQLAQLGHDVMDRLTQNLMIAYAVENSEMAMYESLMAVSEWAGDRPTLELARSIKAEERAWADKIWQRLSPTALSAFHKMAGAEQLTH
ncbi:MAG TPA: DUF892 family protein [Bryobacteraceae bacterium]|nr:DUF892 family protein [Bryobacteraceae bacterium]